VGVRDCRFFEEVRQSVFREADAAARSELADINDSVDTAPTYQIEESSLRQTFVTDCHYLNHINFRADPRITIIQKRQMNAIEKIAWM
jgi:hypothetical protein